MESKLLTLIATGDREKALAGFMYTRNVVKYRWLGDVMSNLIKKVYLPMAW